MKLFFKDENFTFWEFCKRLKWLDLEVEKIKKIFGAFKINKTSEDFNKEKEAAKGINFLPFEIEIRCFTVETFHLKSMKQADKKRTSEVLVFKQRQVNSSQYEYNLRQIYAKK